MTAAERLKFVLSFKPRKIEVTAAELRAVRTFTKRPYANSKPSPRPITFQSMQNLAMFPGSTSPGSKRRHEIMSRTKRPQLADDIDLYWTGPKLAEEPCPIEAVMNDKLEEHQLTSAEKSLAFIFSGNA